LQPKNTLRTHLKNGAITAGVLLVLLAGLFAWEIWKRGADFAFSSDNRAWWAKMLAVAAAGVVLLFGSSVLSDWIKQRRK
jgi:H+/Cl- antiporter ClcA